MNGMCSRVELLFQTFIISDHFFFYNTRTRRVEPYPQRPRVSVNMYRGLLEDEEVEDERGGGDGRMCVTEVLVVEVHSTSYINRV